MYALRDWWYYNYMMTNPQLVFSKWQYCIRLLMYFHAAPSDVNKDLTFKAKDKDKDQTLKAKDQDKD